MKTRFLSLLVASLLFSCNFAPFGERVSGEVYDVKYCNETNDDLEIVTYIGKDIIDRFKIKSNRKRVFYNTRLTYTDEFKSSVFKAVDKTVKRDSILVIKQEKISDLGSHKLYIKLIPSLESEKYEPFSAVMYSEVTIFKNVKTKSLDAFSLNKGTKVFSVIFDDEYFKNALKMYDYEKRGL